MVYHSSFHAGEHASVCGCAILPLNTVAKGPAPPTKERDIIDEVLDLYRANVLFRNYDVRNNADKLLIYLSIFVTACLKRERTSAPAARAARGAPDRRREPQPPARPTDAPPCCMQGCWSASAAGKRRTSCSTSSRTTRARHPASRASCWGASRRRRAARPMMVRAAGAVAGAAAAPVPAQLWRLLVQAHAADGIALGP
jgi:hypothetical protein